MSKCCVSCLFCYGNEPKITWNGPKLNMKIPKDMKCHKSMITIKYAQLACADYKPR